MRTVAGTLRMVRMVRLLAVKRSAVVDCTDKMHSSHYPEAHSQPCELPPWDGQSEAYSVSSCIK